MAQGGTVAATGGEATGSGQPHPVHPELVVDLADLEPHEVATVKSVCNLLKTPADRLGPVRQAARAGVFTLAHAGLGVDEADMAASECDEHVQHEQWRV